MLDRLGLLDEKKKAQLLWRKAYKEAVLNKDKEVSGEVKAKKSDLNKSSDGDIVKNKKTTGGEKMEVKTPKHWQNRELVKAKTAYGNEVMIPKEYIGPWEEQRKLYEQAKAMGGDLSIGVEEYNHTTSIHDERRNSLMVFYEKYQREE